MPSSVWAPAGRAIPSTRASPVSALRAFMVILLDPSSLSGDPSITGPRWVLCLCPYDEPSPPIVDRGRRGSGDGGGDLAGDQPGVQAPAAQEIVVAALLDHAALVQHHDLVGGADGGEPMRDHDG